MNFLLTIEGTDCSFKETQTRMLREAISKLQNDNESMVLGPEVSFPTYKESSYYIKQYLAGEYGTHNNPEVNCLFYTVDRMVDYNNRWKDNYQNGEIIVADRYMGSNMIHQACNIESDDDCVAFCNKLLDFEINVCKLPEPNITVLLLMDPDMAAEIRRNRKNKNGQDKDIHEDDIQHLRNSYENAKRIARLYNWKCVDCTYIDQDGERRIKTREDIHNEVLGHFLEAYNQVSNK